MEAEFKIEWSRAKWIETLEAVEASMEVVLLLAFWVHGVLSMVKLRSHFYRKKKKTCRYRTTDQNNTPPMYNFWNYKSFQ